MTALDKKFRDRGDPDPVRSESSSVELLAGAAAAELELANAYPSEPACNCGCHAASRDMGQANRSFHASSCAVFIFLYGTQPR